MCRNNYTYKMPVSHDEYEAWHFHKINIAQAMPRANVYQKDVFITNLCYSCQEITDAMFKEMAEED